ncbi:MAG: hypothetical protein R3E79_04015 [Caldilineaceae bacterium]
MLQNQTELPEIKTARAVVQHGRIELLENVRLPEGAKVLVTFLPDDDTAFWLGVSQPALDAIWNNEEDDVYAELLKA